LASHAGCPVLGSVDADLVERAVSRDTAGLHEHAPGAKPAENVVDVPRRDHDSARRPHLEHPPLEQLWSIAS
jgi:hypothetical protein